MKIPAASIDGVDLDRVRRQFPSVANEIIRLGDLISHGKDSGEDIVSLTRLLKKVGEDRKAEELLRSNIVDKGDSAHASYVDLFGSRAELDFIQSISKFAEQFAVVLENCEEIGFLRQKCISTPIVNQEISDQRISKFLRVRSEIEFKYESAGTTADISSDIPNLLTQYLILRYAQNTWIYETGK